MAKRIKSEPFLEHPDWTKARFFSFLRSALRSAWSKWPPKYEVLADARRKNESENLKLKWQYQCACCGRWFPQKEVSVDHIEPAGTLRDFEDIAKFCYRLYVGTHKLQVLCDPCHKRKTKTDTEKMKHDRILESLNSSTCAAPDVLPAKPRARKASSRKPKRKRG